MRWSGPGLDRSGVPPNGPRSLWQRQRDCAAGVRTQKKWSIVAHGMPQWMFNIYRGLLGNYLPSICILRPFNCTVSTQFVSVFAVERALGANKTRDSGAGHECTRRQDNLDGHFGRKPATARDSGEGLRGL
mmetsp:Transcript_147403/g.267926  ORF Transcript_147403/g.267926 Transcript_147403/m.267926 type:complete len:131 (+) Transcript_147403:930-1322(+)